MILGSLPCLFLDLHAYVFFALFFLRSTCLCLDLVPMLRSMCLCVSCHDCVLGSMLVAMSCATLALFVP